MQLSINGEPRMVEDGLTVDVLLEQLGLNPKEVVVQRNEDIVERANHPAVWLADGDKLEIIRFVGGG